MSTVTVSPKYQVVIPSKLRKHLDLQPGQKLEVLLYQGRLELVPIRPVSEKRGFLGGMDTRVPRDEDRV